MPSGRLAGAEVNPLLASPFVRGRLVGVQPGLPLAKGGWVRPRTRLDPLLPCPLCRGGVGWWTLRELDYWSRSSYPVREPLAGALSLGTAGNPFCLSKLAYHTQLEGYQALGGAGDG